MQVVPYYPFFFVETAGADRGVKFDGFSARPQNPGKTRRRFAPFRGKDDPGSVFVEPVDKQRLRGSGKVFFQEPVERGFYPFSALYGKPGGFIDYYRNFIFMENFYVFHSDNYNMKKLFVLLFVIPVFAFAEPLHSPTWGFCVDLPEGYTYVDGDAKDRFSFAGPEGLMFELIVYNGRYASMLELANDVNKNISNKGEIDLFRYRDKNAVMIKLEFGKFTGWALGIEMDNLSDPKGPRPCLLALAYGSADKRNLDMFNMSALDSIAPSFPDRYYPGPITEYCFPRGEAVKKNLALKGLSAMVYENDAKASQEVIEREFRIMEAYLNTDLLRNACARYYRFIFRDSCDRIADAAEAITRNLGGFTRGGVPVKDDAQKREFAQKVLAFTQGFQYERDLKGSDFINLVSAVTEGKGDCDSRAMLFAIILAHAEIKSGIMLSHHYSHAMGLADIAGSGARFDSDGVKWLVAETTAKIDIGLIDQQQSSPQHWFAILFE